MEFSNTSTQFKADLCAVREEETASLDWLVTSYDLHRSHNDSENWVGEDEIEISGGEKRVEITFFLYADYLVLCGESEEDLKVVVGDIVGV